MHDRAGLTLNRVGDARLAAVPAQNPNVARLAATTGVEDSAIEHNALRPARDHLRLHRRKLTIVLVQPLGHVRAHSCRNHSRRAANHSSATIVSTFGSLPAIAASIASSAGHTR